MAGEARRMGRRCTLLMSVPRRKLDGGVFDVFLPPQVKREPHTAVERGLNKITNLLSCFCSCSPLMMQRHFAPNRLIALQGFAVERIGCFPAM